MPLLNPLYLIPVLGNLASYFILGSSVSGAQGLFMHYRIELASLISWATIAKIAGYKRLNTKIIAVYVIVSSLLVQYLLHLPLSYLTKEWFWNEPKSVKNINQVIAYIPTNAAVVFQNNITPHVSQRDKIFTLWPEKKTFNSLLVCGKPTCDWFSCIIIGTI